MNLFRSEEHVRRWLEASGWESGTTITSATMCELAHRWWETRVADDWRPRDRDKSQAILDDLGLTGDFWRLA